MNIYLSYQCQRLWRRYPKTSFRYLCADFNKIVEEVCLQIQSYIKHKTFFITQQIQTICIENLFQIWCYFFLIPQASNIQSHNNLSVTWIPLRLIYKLSETRATFEKLFPNLNRQANNYLCTRLAKIKLGMEFEARSAPQLWVLHAENFFSKSNQINPKSDCIYHAPIDLEPNGQCPLCSKPIGKW